MSDEEISHSELILNNYALYAAIIWISTLVLVGNDSTNWIIVTAGIIFLHAWVYLLEHNLTQISVIMWLTLFVILPKSSILLFSLVYLIINISGYGRYIMNAVDFIFYKKDTVQDINDLCIPVMFVTVILYYLKQQVGWQN
jgi:hypothetical protein